MSEETKQTPEVEPKVDVSDTAGDNEGRKFNRNSDAAIGALAGEPKYRSKRRRKVSYLTINKIYSVDHKDVAILRRFINDRGKILSAKFTGNTAKQQRMVSQAIRRAREMALLPFVVSEITPDRPMRSRDRGDRPYRDRGDRGERPDRNDRSAE